jgi:hypothetical protein
MKSTRERLEGRRIAMALVAGAARSGGIHLNPAKD